MRLFVSILCAMTLMSGFASAQNVGSGSFTIGGGFSYGIGESHPEDRIMNGQFRMGFMYAFSRGVAVELGGGYTVFSSNTLEKLYDYSTSAIPIDMRLKLSPFQISPGIKPYVYAGLGRVSYTYDRQGLNVGGWRDILNSKGPNAIPFGLISDSTGTGAWYAPLGVGMYVKMSSRWGLDFTLGGYPTFNDDMNPMRDGQNDGYWSGMVNLVYNFRDDMTDTDRDGLTDEDEVNVYHTDPNNPDTDADGLKDGEEVLKYHTDPNRADTDADGLKDGEEVLKYNTDPLKQDTDNDGVNDGDEVNIYKTNPLNADSDGDGINDVDEIKVYKTNPNKADTDGDGLKDAEEIKINKTDPLKEDSDNDGLTDGEEVKTNKTDPLKADSDSDELSDGDEVKKYNTNPLDRDTDHGSVPDGEEVKIKKTNPLDPRDDVQKAAPKMDVSRRIVLDGIKFENNKAEILPVSEPVLDSAYRTLVDSPDMIVEVQGHASKSKNKRRKEKQEIDLSQRRAEAVRNWLIRKGIAPNRMVPKGYGTSQLALPSDPRNEANRRIEFLRMN